MIRKQVYDFARLLLGAWFIANLGLVNAMASETEHETEHEEKFVLGVFLGGTEVQDEWKSTLGLELSYFINHTWSVRALIEQSSRDKDTTLAMVGLGLHPYKELILIAGIGQKDPSGEHESAIRLGMAYEIEFSNGWGIEPFVGVDIIEHEEHEPVLGVYFIKNF